MKKLSLQNLQQTKKGQYLYINSLKKQEKATGKSMARQISIQRAAYKKIEQMSKTTGK